MTNLRRFKADPFVVVFCLLATSSALAADAPRFSQVQERSPESIWAAKISPKLRSSLEAYQQHKKLKNGTEYGSLIRSLDLGKVCASQIVAWATEHSCIRENELVRSPKDNLPLHGANGKVIKMVAFLCPDGSVIRMKPYGDPSQPKNSEPNAVKAMRFFGRDRYENFSDEAFKVDNAGLPVPKWPKDLNTKLPGLDSSTREAFIGEWARDAHTDLKVCP